MTTIAGAGAFGAPAAQPTGLGALSPDQFFKVILTELSSQDPLQPNDTTALLQQLSTIRSIQSDIDLSDRLARLVGQNEFVAGAGLIGSRVSGLSESMARVEGIVRSVSRTEHGAVLNLVGGERMPMRSLDEVLADEPPVQGAAS